MVHASGTSVVSGHGVYFHGKNELAACCLQRQLKARGAISRCEYCHLIKQERKLLHPSDRVLLFYSDPEDEETNFVKSCTRKDARWCRSRTKGAVHH
ncbi:DUF2529 family protein [Bacillus sp. SL00103]